MWLGCQSLFGITVELYHHPLSLNFLCPQGVITAAKELDYEISHGRYTLIVTATDQCPILSHRLTSTTTVSGIHPQCGDEGKQRIPRRLPDGRERKREIPVGRKCLQARAPVYLGSSSRLAVLL